MEVAIEVLLKDKIKDIYYDGEAMGLLLENGAKLSIFNELNLIGLKDPQELKDTTITHISEQADEIEFTVSTGAALRVSLKDDAWKGPEAIELCLPNGDIIVWS